LNGLWEQYINDNRRWEVNREDVTLINRDRKRFLLEGQNFIAPGVTEVLSLVKGLSPELYEEISVLRKVRSGWIHNLASVSRKHSGRGIRTAEAIMACSLDVRFAVPLEPGQRYADCYA
jgi:hypothetical protein